MDGSEVSTVTMWILGDPLVAGEGLIAPPHNQIPIYFKFKSLSG
jgi:hypothetical protein